MTLSIMMAATGTGTQTVTNSEVMVTIEDFTQIPISKCSHFT